MPPDEREIPLRATESFGARTRRGTWAESTQVLRGSAKMERMTHEHSPLPTDVAGLPPDHPYLVELDGERHGWYELAELVRTLTPAECFVPGYYRDPDWTVRDVVAHLGTWLAEAQVQFQRLRAGTYEGHDIDIDGLNVIFAAAMRGQPWDVTWTQANAARSMMVGDWHGLRQPTEEAAWWIRKSGVDHYAEHLPRLHEWAAELVSRRAAGGR